MTLRAHHGIQYNFVVSVFEVPPIPASIQPFNAAIDIAPVPTVIIEKFLSSYSGVYPGC